MVKMPRKRADDKTETDSEAHVGAEKSEKRSFFTGKASLWLAENWGTIVLLMSIVGVALFLRTYFGLGPATQSGFLVSGGSDSYYHKRIIDYALATGHQLYQDPLLNYPLSTRNPRPPLFVWSTVIAGYIFSPLFGSVDVATWYAFLFNTAFWGAMTVIPVYFITKESFGKRAAFIAALLLAIMPGHIQRSVFSNADHDAMVQFFVVLSFFFLLKALKTINGSRWVKNWRKKEDVVSGMKEFFRDNRTAVLYSFMASLSLSAIAMIWKGFSYVVIIILVYYLVQIFISRFKNTDTLGATIVIFVTLATMFLLIFPIYYEVHIVKTWYDVPLLLFLSLIIVGGIFTVTRDYPWTLVLGIFSLMMAVGYLVFMVIFPSISQTIISGQGYLVQSKLYTTISEAQRPGFSNMAISFGMVTFYLSFVGAVWALVKIPKKATADFIFVVIWVAVAIYMATSAARFMFNASPAFAIAAGWVLAEIINALHLKEIRRNLSGFEWRRPWQGIKKAIKVRHVLGVLFVAFMILLPNIWFAVDAGIPYEVKSTYDEQVNNSLPDFLASPNRPENGIWYFGAFGYSLPMPSNYWPASWRWFAQQDADTYPEADRPAFVSWWDYGFEAAQEGHHPTVADNFQNGYQWAGNVITAQNESETIALFAGRIIETAVLYGLNPDRAVDPNMNQVSLDEITALLDEHGLDSQKIVDIVVNPEDYVSVVLENPDVYGYYNYDLSPTNAKYAMLKTELSVIGEENLVWMYRDLRDLTGDSIQYFAIDSRLFPFDARSTGIFYAPVKLADRRIDNGTRNPVDFYDIKAVDEYGKEHDLDADLDPNLKIVDYRIHYKDMFFNSMLYRSYIGYSGSDIGQPDDTSIPGLSGTLQQQPPMQAWNMSHFKLVYRTAYYNPYPSSEVRAHPEAWRAISYDEAAKYQDEINSGERTGVVDMSAGSALRQGVVFVKYYDGAIINGTVKMDNGAPVPGIRVTILDEYFIPHGYAMTDENGRFSLIAPAGNMSLVASAGEPNPLNLIGADLSYAHINITEDQGMRVREDLDMDGIYDYNIHQDLIINSGNLGGNVYWDVDGDSARSAPALVLEGAKMILSYSNSSFEQETNISADGLFAATSLLPGTYSATVIVDGKEIKSPSKIVVKEAETSSVSIAVPSAHVEIKAVLAGGSNLSLHVSLVKKDTGRVVGSNITGTDGTGVIEPLAPGDYELVSSDDSYTFSPVSISIGSGERTSVNLTAYPSVQVRGAVTLNGLPLDGASVFFNCRNASFSYSAVSSDGAYEVALPVGYLYDVYSIYIDDGERYIYIGTVFADASRTHDVSLEKGVKVYGNAHPPMSTSRGLREATIHFFSGDSDVRAVTYEGGAYEVWLTPGTYDVYTGGPQIAFADRISVDSSMRYDIDTGYGFRLYGYVWMDENMNHVMDAEEVLDGVRLTITNSRGVSIRTMCNETGYSFYLLPGEYTMEIDDPIYESISMAISMPSSNMTKNIAVNLRNVTLSGRVSDYSGNGLSAIDVSIIPQQGQPYYVTSDVHGMYTIDVRPGDYRIVVDQNVTTWIKYLMDERISIPVGASSMDYDIVLEEKIEVTGQIGNRPSDNATTVLRFSGPEDKNITVAGETYATYLIAGDYSLEAVSAQGGITHMNLSILSISPLAANQVDIKLQPAYSVSGGLKYGGEPFSHEMTLAFAADSGAVVHVSTPDGTYSANLPEGNYTVSGVFRTVDVVDDSLRFVRYTAHESIKVSGDSVVDISLSRDFDNYTVSGTIFGLNNMGVRASIRFYALNETAMDTSAESDFDGFYSVSLAPGEYSVYVFRADDDSVNLTRFTHVREDAALNITLEEGLLLRGDVKTDTGLSVPEARILVRADDGPSTESTADETGTYSIYLPSGGYDISATGVIVERGLDVQFNGMSAVEILTPLRADLVLNREAIYSSVIKWDSRQARTVKGGESVTYTFTVENTGNVKDTYDISASVPDGWEYEVSEETIVLDFGENNRTDIGITITTSPDALVDHSPVTVYAISRAKPNTRPAKVLDLEIEPVYAVSIQKGTGGNMSKNSISYVVTVMNDGNTQDRFSLSISNAEDLRSMGWEAVLIDPTIAAETGEAIVDVGAHQKSEITVILKPLNTYPSTTASLILYAESMDHNASATYSLELSLPDLVPSEAELTVSGASVSTEIPDHLTYNMTQVSVIILLGIAAVYLARKKGVI